MACIALGAGTSLACCIFCARCSGARPPAPPLPPSALPPGPPRPTVFLPAPPARPRRDARGGGRLPCALTSPPTLRSRAPAMPAARRRPPAAPPQGVAIAAAAPRRSSAVARCSSSTSSRHCAPAPLPSPPTLLPLALARRSSLPRRPASASGACEHPLPPPPPAPRDWAASRHRRRAPAGAPRRGERLHRRPGITSDGSPRPTSPPSLLPLLPSLPPPGRGGTSARAQLASAHISRDLPARLPSAAAAPCPLRRRSPPCPLRRRSPVPARPPTPLPPSCPPAHSQVSPSKNHGVCRG